MANPPKPALVQQPFTRLVHPDPKTNQIVQDLYDKLQQIQALVASKIQS